MEADLGLVDEARASAERGSRPRRGRARRWCSVPALGVLGRVELALGNLETAGGYLRELPDRLASQAVERPDAPSLGRRDRDPCRAGRAGARPAAIWSSTRTTRERLGSPWAVAGAARCRGLLAAAEGEPTRRPRGVRTRTRRAATPTRTRSSAAGRCSASARCAGRRSRRRPRGRRSSEALAIFEELGARLWAEKARAELARISGRAPASEELTETERRVAELAAQGRTNKQIAAELYMGLSTVEAHLSHVYRKLGVRRAELAARLAAPQGAPRQGRGRAPPKPRVSGVSSRRP